MNKLAGLLPILAAGLLAAGAVTGLVRLRTGQLSPERRASESLQIEIARHQLLLENLDALPDAPATAGNLTGAPQPGKLPAADPSPRDTVAEWQRMSEAEHAKIQESYRQWQALSPARQRELEDRYRRFESLPPERRRELERVFGELEKLAPAERESRLNESRKQRNL
jgi:hypothetical protein